LSPKRAKGSATPAFILATNGWHPSNEPLRPAFLIHSWRLILAMEALLGDEQEKRDLGKRVIGVYDCGEDSGVEWGHKAIRFYVTSKDCELVPLGRDRRNAHGVLVSCT
jgi:hypothetical protein